MRIIGIMSGSSLDGLDLACVEFSEESDLKWEIILAKKYELSELLKKELKDIINQNTREIARTEYHFTKSVADAICDFQKHLNGNAQCAGVHGHTVLHDISINKSWQLLNPGYLASHCKIDIIHDFRCQDMAFGGMGTPMTVIADRDLFSGYNYYLNLGGIANISFKRDGQWCAYDLAPFNQMHDYFAGKMNKDFDDQGMIASKGKHHPDILKNWLEHPFVLKPYPKYIDNQEVQDDWIRVAENSGLNIQDVLYNYSNFLSTHLSDIINEMPGTILISGGGTRNSFFINLLKQKLSSDSSVFIPDEQIIEFKEAVLMAYMAYLRICGKANFIPDASGASEQVSAGGYYHSS